MVRFKNRYFLCLFDTDCLVEPQDKVQRLGQREIMRAVRDSVSQNFGDLGSGQLQSSLAVKWWAPALRMCIIRSSRDHFRTTWAAITLITRMETQQQLGAVRLRVIHVGGTIRSCQKSAFKHARQVLLEERKKGGDATKVQTAIRAAKRDLNEMVI